MFREASAHHLWKTRSLALHRHRLEVGHAEVLVVPGLREVVHVVDEELAAVEHELRADLQVGRREVRLLVLALYNVWNVPVIDNKRYASRASISQQCMQCTHQKAPCSTAGKWSADCRGSWGFCSA